MQKKKSVLFENLKKQADLHNGEYAWLTRKYKFTVSFNI